MAASYLITLGVGTPSSIPTFILVGLSPGQEAPFVPVVIMDLRTTFDALEAGDTTLSTVAGGRSTLDASIDLRGPLD